MQYNYICSWSVGSLSIDCITLSMSGRHSAWEDTLEYGSTQPVFLSIISHAISPRQGSS